MGEELMMETLHDAGRDSADTPLMSVQSEAFSPRRYSCIRTLAGLQYVPPQQLG